MKQKIARMMSIALERDAQYSSRGRKGFVGAMPLPPELKKHNISQKGKAKSE
ncbi:hypothetical protein [Paenibacillus polymyxa]|uniref:hypothetical protein n=1 Tax=Paenibacillus polymyxa TaxID=1406 RepID=UPI0025B66EBC|nr:hypothetical protein [Paenibacillus polymyxa]MDN4090980.1 hypothetical protein [Paenibacillus polymyxa]